MTVTLFNYNNYIALIVTIKLFSFHSVGSGSLYQYNCDTQYTVTNKILQYMYFITKTRNIDDRQIMDWPGNPTYTSIYILYIHQFKMNLTNRPRRITSVSNNK